MNKLNNQIENATDDIVTTWKDLQDSAKTARMVARARYKDALAGFWAAEAEYDVALEPATRNADTRSIRAARATFDATRAALDLARATYATKCNSHEAATVAVLEAEEMTNE